MPTRDLSSSLDDDALLYPGIRSKAYPDGKTYLVPAPDGMDGLLYLRLFELGANLASGADISDEDKRRLQLDGDDEGSFLRKILSKDTYDEMLADGVPWPKMKEIVEDAFLCWGANEELAEAVKAARRGGKAPAPPNRAARRAAAKKQPGAKPTAKKTAGSKSSPASSATPARTAAKASTPSSKSTPTAQPAEAAAS